MGCKSGRDTIHHVCQQSITRESTEQIELLTQREALLQGLTITLDSVALTVPISRKPIDSHRSFLARNDMGFPSADSVPPHEVNLIAKKVTIQKSDFRTITYEDLNARRNTIATHEESAEMVKEEEQKTSGANPPNGIAIAIFLVFTLLLGVFFTAKKRP